MRLLPDTPLFQRLPLVLAVFLAVACEVPTGVVTEEEAASGSNQEPVAPPAAAGSSTPFYSGVFLGDDATKPERVYAALEGYTRTSGRAPALVKSFHRIDADLSAQGWAGRLVREVSRFGATNYLALDLSWGGAPANLLNAIRRGDADALLARTARSLADIGRPVMLEPGWEMNGDWGYGWQGVANGAGSEGPRTYVEAWRHVVDVFRAQGATNVLFVFNPNTGNPVGGAGTGHWNWYGNYYPGDQYVDYIGAHGFNAPSVWGHRNHSFDDLFYGDDADHMLPDMLKRFPNKPIIIGELGTEAAGDKPAWIKRAYERMLANPRVVGAIWFDMAKEADWRIASNPGGIEAYRAALSNARVSTSLVAPAVRVTSR